MKRERTPLFLDYNSAFTTRIISNLVREVKKMPEITVTAPEGSHFEFEEVKTDRGTKSLGDVPILVWDDIDAVVEHYGAEGILASLDGTSFRVSYQSIARRYKLAGKSDDEIATALVEFKPGKRAAGVSTPVSRAKRAAKDAAEKMGDQADAVTDLLKLVADGKMTADQVRALVSAAKG